MDMTQVLSVVGLVAFLFSFYAIGIYLNRRTPLPEGCELPSLACADCKSPACGYSEVSRPPGTSIKDEITRDIQLMKSKKEVN
jgi:hypothetical protein